MNQKKEKNDQRCLLKTATPKLQSPRPPLVPARPSRQSHRLGEESDNSEKGRSGTLQTKEETEGEMIKIKLNNEEKWAVMKESTNAPAAVREFRSFDGMGLPTALLRGVYSAGFERPSPIQARAIVPLASGGDIIAQAPSGTGKTCAFGVGLLQRIDWGKPAVQALVLSPTRELAEQTAEVIEELGFYLSKEQQQHRKTEEEEGEEKKTFCKVFVGATSVATDEAALHPRRLQHLRVAVGTPGRIGHLLRTGYLRASALATVVLDEADQLFAPGFDEQLMRILQFVPRDVQLALFSATLPPRVIAAANQLMRAEPTPTRILVPPEELSLKGIRNFKVEEGVETDEAKLFVVRELFSWISVSQCIIFVSTRERVEAISAALTESGHAVASVHAEMGRAERLDVLRRFRRCEARVLVATDLFARGIDVQHVNVVVNYDVPSDRACYLHRVGRSGRYGRRGTAINFVSARERPLLRAISRQYGIDIPDLKEDDIDMLLTAD